MGADNELGTAVTLLPHFTEAELNNPAAPKAEIPTTIDLGSFGDKQELKGTLLLTNSGKSPLKSEQCSKCTNVASVFLCLKAP